MKNERNRNRKICQTSSTFRWQSGHKSLPQLTFALSSFKKYFLRILLNSSLFLINFMLSSGKSAQSWGKVVKGCFEVCTFLANGICNKLTTYLVCYPHIIQGHRQKFLRKYRYLGYLLSFRYIKKQVCRYVPYRMVPRY